MQGIIGWGNPWNNITFYRRFAQFRAVYKEFHSMRVITRQKAFTKPQDHAAFVR